jgi:hypothetical protein
MFNKSLSIGVALAIMGSAAWAAQIGDTVQATVTVNDRVNVPGSSLQNAPTEVTHITLESGVWMISGQINMLAFLPPAVGTVFFTAGNISLDEPSFEPAATAAVQAERSSGGSPIRPVALVPRVVEVEDGQEVFLTAGNFNTGITMSAWGFITAVKIRNHVAD